MKYVYSIQSHYSNTFSNYILLIFYFLKGNVVYIFLIKDTSKVASVNIWKGMVTNFVKNNFSDFNSYNASVIAWQPKFECHSFVLNAWVIILTLDLKKNVLNIRNCLYAKNKWEDRQFSSKKIFYCLGGNLCKHKTEREPCLFTWQRIMSPVSCV